MKRILALILAALVASSAAADPLWLYFRHGYVVVTAPGMGGGNDVIYSAWEQLAAALGGN